MDNRFLLRKNIFLVIISLLVLSSNAWAAIQYGAKDLGAMWFIGDSITQSNADGDNNGSPRKSLYDLLVAGGYDFSYTGHWQVNIDGLPSTVTSGGGRGGGGAITEEFYYYHSGVSASVIGDNYGSRVGMTENLPSFWTQGRLATAKPDVILIMLGTNDVGNGIDLANAPSRLVTFVQRIHELPDVGSPTVFLASIPPSRRTTQGAVDVIAFNSFVPGIVADFQTQGKDVHFVDQFTPLDNNYATVMRPDNLHPNAAGNDTMAEQWLHGIVEVVTDPNVVALTGVTPQTGKAPMEVHFDASASRAKDSIASYNWDFGDGNSISGMTADHTYLQAGTFRATLTVTDIHNVTDTASVNIVTSEWPGTPTDFYSFYLYTFATNGLDCKVAVPDVMAEGKPWVWRARFWGHEPGPDIELLRHGFHVVYVDVAGLYGAPSAVARFDAFYDFLTVSHGFDRRAVLEGMSRGGLIIYNWAAQNADKIHCVYADAPVCDFKSWPGITTEIMAAYGFSSVAEAEAYLGNPVDNMQPLAEAGIPLLHVVGDLDTTVPVAENTAIVEERYRAFGGWIEVIHKPEAGHTHGLDDPTPIVDFILNGMSYLYNRPASNITFGSATFNGILSLPGMQYDIQVYWGTSDGGTDITAWDYSAPLGAWILGDSAQVSFAADALESATTYYYAFNATNESESLWSLASVRVTTQVASLTAKVSAHALVGTLPFIVHFDASASQADLAIIAYDWDFGDGAVASGILASHTYTSSGTFTATITITDAIGQTQSATIDISASPVGDTIPVAVISAIPVSGTIPLVVNFSAYDSHDDKGIIAYAWDFGDGHTGSGISSLHTYVSPGTFSASLTVTDTAGVRVTATEILDVFPEDLLVTTIQSNTPPTVSNNDLAQTQYRTSSATGGNEISTQHAELFNGLVGNEDMDYLDPGEVMMTSANTLTIEFDTSVNARGYDITGIDSIFGTNPTGGGRTSLGANQGYEIILTFIDGTSATLAGPMHWEKNAPVSTYWTKVSFSNTSGGVLGSHAISFNGEVMAGSNVVATSVKAVTFDITENSSTNAGVIAREIDVFGVPTE